MKDDAVIAEIHKIKESIAARYNYDIHAMGKALREMQAKSGRKIVNLGPRKSAMATKV